MLEILELRILELLNQVGQKNFHTCFDCQSVQQQNFTMKFLPLFVMFAIFCNFVPIESSKALNKMKKQIKKLEKKLRNYATKKDLNKKADKVHTLSKKIINAILALYKQILASVERFHPVLRCARDDNKDQKQFPELPWTSAIS